MADCANVPTMCLSTMPDASAFPRRCKRNTTLIGRGRSASGIQQLLAIADAGLSWTAVAAEKLRKVQSSKRFWPNLFLGRWLDGSSLLEKLATGSGCSAI